MAKKYQHHKLPSCLGYPKHEGKDEENLTHFFGHYPGYRCFIETVNDELKNIAQVEHSRHRCFDNFIVNLLGAIAAYCLFPKKPCINVQGTIDTRLALF